MALPTSALRRLQQNNVGGVASPQIGGYKGTPNQTMQTQNQNLQNQLLKVHYPKVSNLFLIFYFNLF